MRLLIPLDQSKEARAAADFAGLLHALQPGAATLLAVVHRSDEQDRERARLETVRAQDRRLTGADIKIRIGDTAPEIAAEASSGNYELLIMGQRGQRRLARMLIGNTALKLVDACPIPMIIMQTSRPELRRILVCTSGSATASANVEVAARLAARSGANLTILHVMSQIDLTPESPAPGLEEAADWHLAHATDEGRHLRKLEEIAEEIGISPRLVIRHGLVLDEILAETRAGNYDMVVLGANRVHGMTRFLIDDVTKAVIKQLQRPVLIVP